MLAINSSFDGSFPDITGLNNKFFLKKKIENK